MSAENVAQFPTPTPEEPRFTDDEIALLRQAQGMWIESQRLQQMAALIEENVGLRAQIRRNEPIIDNPAAPAKEPS